MRLREQMIDLESKQFTKLKVYLPRRVQGGWPIGHNVVVEAGVHDAIANQYGAVSVVLPNGELLGVKPGEFQHVQ